MENVAWSYERPLEPVAGIKDLVAFYPDRVDIVHERAPALEREARG